MCKCGKRSIIDAIGRVVENFYEVYTPHYGSATTAGKTIIAGPVEIAEAFECSGGSGFIRSATIREFGTSQKLDIDIVFTSVEPVALAVNHVTGFIETSPLSGCISFAAGDYVDKQDYWEAQANLKFPISVCNKSLITGSGRKLWFYLVARDAKTFTSSTRLAVSITIESD